MPPVAPPIVNSDRIARPGQSSTSSGAVDSGSSRINRPVYDSGRGSSFSKFGLNSLDEPKVAPPINRNTSSSSVTAGGVSGSELGSGSGSATGTPSGTGSGSGTGTPAGASISGSSATDMYPKIGKLENLTFGVSKPELTIEDRLVALETAVFARTYPHDSLFDRTERLETTLLGKNQIEAPPIPEDGPLPGWAETPMTSTNGPDPSELMYLDEIIDRPDSYHKIDKATLDSFARELINFERQKLALGKLEHNHLAQKMADEHLRDLVERGVVSHNNSKGDNPDRRYTLLGGVDAVNENLAVIGGSELGPNKLCKAAVAKIFKQMLMQQDGREALMAPEATHLGFAIESMNEGASVLACTEVLTNRGVIHPIPKTASLGEKIEVEGSIQKPYVFQRITLAWEGVSDLPPQEENSSEALPYFPPLDFVAYKEKSEKDHSKAIFALKTVGMLAAIAGGVFVPPVALAAPLIMMAGPGPGEVKPLSDVPVKGGVKVSGESFSAKVTVNNDNKEGLYYLTVWANMGADDKPIAISRRTILVKQVHDEEEVKGDVSIPSQEKSDTADDAKKKKSKDSLKVNPADDSKVKLPDTGTERKETDAKPSVGASATPEALPPVSSADKPVSSTDQPVSSAGQPVPPPDQPVSSPEQSLSSADQKDSSEHEDDSIEYTKGELGDLPKIKSSNSDEKSPDDVKLNSESSDEK